MNEVRMESLSGQRYTMIRKVSWDMLWHACWFENGDRLNWDRVDKNTAMIIAANL